LQYKLRASGLFRLKNRAAKNKKGGSAAFDVDRLLITDRRSRS